nr:ribokinase [Spirochaetota bacterium]
MKRPKICVVGACNIDLISYVPRLPVMGETLHGTQFRMGFGGKGANQAGMAAKLGGGVPMGCQLGDDGFGNNTIGNFQKWGVDIDNVYVTGKTFSGVGPFDVGTEGNI